MVRMEIRDLLHLRGERELPQQPQPSCAGDEGWAAWLPPLPDDPVPFGVNPVGSAAGACVADLSCGAPVPAWWRHTMLAFTCQQTVGLDALPAFC